MLSVYDFLGQVAEGGIDRNYDTIRVRHGQAYIRIYIQGLSAYSETAQP